MGGDSLGIYNCGIELVAYSEINQVFQKTHELNFPDSKLIGNGDITKTFDNGGPSPYDFKQVELTTSELSRLF